MCNNTMLAVIICIADHYNINDLYNFNIFVHMDLAIKIFFARVIIIIFLYVETDMLRSTLFY